MTDAVEKSKNYGLIFIWFGLQLQCTIGFIFIRVKENEPKEYVRVGRPGAFPCASRAGGRFEAHYAQIIRASLYQTMGTLLSCLVPCVAGLPASFNTQWWVVSQRVKIKAS